MHTLNIITRFTCVRVWPTRRAKPRSSGALSHLHALSDCLWFFVFVSDFSWKKNREWDTTPSWTVSRAHMRARRSTPNSGSREWKTARSANRRAMRRGDSKRSAFRVESRENRPRKINDARASVSAARDSLPLPLANDSRVINRSSGESFSVEKYRISRVCDARYPVITKFPTGFSSDDMCVIANGIRANKVYRFFFYSLLSIIGSYRDKTN